MEFTRIHKKGGIESEADDESILDAIEILIGRVDCHDEPPRGHNLPSFKDKAMHLLRAARHYCIKSGIS